MDIITKSVNGCERYFTTGAAYDTESTTISHIENEGKEDEKTVIDHCFVYHIQFALDEEYYSFRSFNDFKGFFCRFIGEVKEKQAMYDEEDAPPPKMIIWVANLSHEWAFMKNIFDNELPVTKIFAKSKREPLLIEIAGAVQFREAIGLFGHSLADISKNWCKKYKKLSGDLDYSKTRTFNTYLDETEQAYCRNDVLVLTEMHKNVFEAYTRPNGVMYLPYTVSGFVRLRLKEAIENTESLTEARKTLGGKWLNKSNVQLLKRRNMGLYTTAEDWNLIRTYGFSGGVTGSNIEHVGKELHNIKCADITSDYPYQMLNERFPNGPIRAGKQDDFENALRNNLPCFALLHIGEMRAKTNHAVFSKHKVINLNELRYMKIFGAPMDSIVLNGKILAAKKIVVIMNDVDLKIYTKAYDLRDVTVLKCWYFPWGYKKLPEWLRNCVIADYITKAKIKKELGSHAAQQNVEYRDSKSRVNTYFGTLATRPDDIFNALDDLQLFTPEKEFTFEDLRRNTWLNPYWAFYITSYARKMLIEKILVAPRAIVQYDTDSLYYRADTKDGNALEKALEKFNADCIAKNKRQFKKIENAQFLDDLGTWDFDETYSRFLCLGAKKYIKECNGQIETVIAGLPKSAIPKEIVTKGLQNPFESYNAVTAEKGQIIIDHIFRNKLASMYCDVNYTKYVPITDYTGETVLQPESSYHALVPIDFTLGIAQDYLQHIRQFAKIKALR